MKANLLSAGPTALALLLALGPGGPASAAAGSQHIYRVTLDSALTELAVEARLSGSVQSLQARNNRADRYLRNPRQCAGEQPLRVRRDAIALPEQADVCVRYEVDLAKLAEQRRYRRSSFQTPDRLASPTAWLWQPSMTTGDEVRIHFKLPPGIRVSVPWEPVGDPAAQVYRFGPSPESSNAIAIFGTFDYREIAVPGATLRVSLLQGSSPVEEDVLLAWLEAAAGNVAGTFGRFPNPSPQVVVVPMPDRDGRSAVPFGRVIRDGGEAVQFFVAAGRPLEDYLTDWTATHEFSHLLLPYVDRKWISEGFASYYQNVLMARAGAYSKQRAWQKLHEGFERGRRSAPRSSPNEASRGWRSGLMKVYWSGAAIALMADVALRSQPGGESLDAVLGRLQSCCLPAERMWGGLELFARLDALSNTSVFTELYTRYADSKGFPDLAALFDYLGLGLYGDQVTLSDAPLARIREDIMNSSASPRPIIGTAIHKGKTKP